MRGETMGQRLKRLRERAGLTQRQAAEASGVPLGTLRRWEQDVAEPLLSGAARLAEALGVSLDELAGVRRKRRKKEK
jgi:transcriptional regulator with XRE-family HTH domain